MLRSIFVIETAVDGFHARSMMSLTTTLPKFLDEIIFPMSVKVNSSGVALGVGRIILLSAQLIFFVREIISSIRGFDSDGSAIDG